MKQLQINNNRGGGVMCWVLEIRVGVRLLDGWVASLLTLR
jgi:hypothetical protein